MEFIPMENSKTQDDLLEKMQEDLCKRSPLNPMYKE